MDDLKLSLVISTSDAAFNALAFKGELENGMKMAKEIGYNAVEIAIRDPKVIDPEKINSLRNEIGLDISAIGTGQAYLAEKLSLTSEDEKLRLRAIERLKEHIELSSKIGGLVIIGLIRGIVGNRDKEKVTHVFIESVKEVAEYAKEFGVKLVIEPLNRYESDFLNTADETAQVIKKISMDNLGLLLDTFHMNIEERSIEESIRKHKDILLHFHVADSNRWAPGYGHIDFHSIFKTLFEIGYDGYISVECMPLPGGTEFSSKEAYKFLSKILNGR